MTEEIIIDGVDVAGCRDYREVEYKEMAICMNYYNHLPKPPKETGWQYCAGNKNCYYKQHKRLEQENKELRQQYNCYACDTCQGKEDYRNMKRHCENAIKTVHAYRSVLEEIKEFAEPIYEQIPEDRVLRQILLKISEVLNDK